METLHLTNYIFSLKFVGIVFISSLYDSIISSHVISESSIIPAKYFTFLQIHALGFQTYSFSHVWCFLHSHWHLSLFNYWFELHFVPTTLHLHWHDMWFFNVLDSFISVSLLNTLRFQSSVLFGTHIFLDKSFRVLQLPTHLSNATANG